MRTAEDSVLERRDIARVYGRALVITIEFPKESHIYKRAQRTQRQILNLLRNVKTQRAEKTVVEEDAKEEYDEYKDSARKTLCQIDSRYWINLQEDEDDGTWMCDAKSIDNCVHYEECKYSPAQEGSEDSPDRG